MFSESFDSARNSTMQVFEFCFSSCFVFFCFFVFGAVSNSQLIYKYAFITNKFRNQLSVKFHLMTSTSSRCGYNCFPFSQTLFEQHFKIVLLDTRYYFNNLYITFTLTFTLTLTFTIYDLRFTFTYRYSITFWFYFIVIFALRFPFIILERELFKGHIRLSYNYVFLH